MSLANFEVPTGGWNARDNVDAMGQLDALEMVNIVPENQYIRTRGGTETHCDVGALPIETLVVYGNNEKLLCTINGSFQDVTTSTAAHIKSGFTNNRWQYINAEKRMIFVNGADTPQVYDGSTMTDAVFSLFQSDGTTPSTYADTDLWGANLYKQRAFYWPENAQLFFYSDFAGGSTGNLIEYDLSPHVSSGGVLVAMYTYSRGENTNLDDYAVFHFSTGECLVFEGDDPGDPLGESWSMVQKYQTGQPLAIRGNCKYGGDQVVITRDGFINLSTALPNQAVSKEGNIGDKIINAAKQAAERFADNYGWEVNLFLEKSLLIFNIPRLNKYDQYVLNTSTNGWCKFQDIQAITWAVFNNELYYGDDSGNVKKAETGTSDDGAHIQWKFITRFGRFGSPGRRKTVTGVSLTHNYAYPKYIRVDVLRNYQRSSSETLETPLEYQPFFWDVGFWDVGYWDVGADPENGATRRTNYPAGGSGHSIAIKVRGQSAVQKTTIYDLSVRFKQGGRV